MFKQEIKTGKEAQKALLAGVTALVDVIGRTLGPRSRCVALTAPGALPLVINDGVTIARQIALNDPFEDVGAQLVKEASIRTAEVAGDGTTTSALLALEIFRRGADLIAGHSLVELKKGMDAALDEITKKLQAWALPVSLDGTKLDEICTISANNDAFLGSLIAEAFRKVGGKDGIVTVEASNDTESKVIVSEGFRFDKGYLNRAFVTNEREEIVMEDACVLVAEREFSDYREILEFLKNFQKEAPGRNLLWVVNGMNASALQVLIQNKMLGKLKVAVVEAPLAGIQRREFLEDLALYTGAKFLGSASGFKMDNVTVKQLGNVGRVHIRAHETAFIHDQFHDLSLVEKRLTMLRETLAKEGPAISEADSSFLLKRISWLSAKAARVSLTFVSVAEMKEKMARVDDAIRAAQAALEEGYLPGGCLPFLSLGWGWAEETATDPDSGFEVGRKLVYESLAYPFQVLLNNMGYAPDFQNTVVADLKKGWSDTGVGPFASLGFNALSGNCEDLIAAGILDPLKVVRMALRNSVSVAYTLLSMDAVVINMPDSRMGG